MREQIDPEGHWNYRRLILHVAAFLSKFQNRELSFEN